MSTKHRLNQAIVKISQAGGNWAYETWSEGNHAYFVFESERSAQLVREFFWLAFKDGRRQLIHKGRKPTTTKEK